MVNPVTWLQRSVLALCLLPGLSAASDCFPRPDSNKPQYLVVYGLILHKETRMVSPEQMMKSIPVWVEGYKRGWFSQSPPLTIPMTQLGAVAAPGAKFNALVVPMEQGQITSVDRDDKAVCREKISFSSLKPVNEMKIKDDGEYWIYITKKKQQREAVANFPIYQSFVDEFLTGCIEQSERLAMPDFADECMKTTSGWNSSWVNDRQRPVLKRAVQIKKELVDNLLIKYEEKYFAPIRLR